jgi:anti-sigma B factor antagonist
MADNKLQLSVVDGRRSSEKVMVLEGVLNAETAFHVRDAARQDVPEMLVIDMSGVRHVDSSGIGVLIGLYVSFEQKSKRILLAGISDRVWDLFRKCKIDDVFTRYATVADAELAEPNAGPNSSGGDRAAPVTERSPLLK